MSSIGVGLREAADLTRTAVLTIKPLSATTTAERIEQEQQWRKLQSACAAIPIDTPQKLLARQVHHLPLIRKNIEVFKEVIAVNLGNRRLGDQLGTLLAGMMSLFSTTEMTKEGCEKFLEGYDWTDFTTVKTLREDLALLYHLANSRVRVDTAVGMHERLIGELIEMVLNNSDDGVINPVSASNTLLRLGIRIDLREGGIWIATGVTGMKQIMSSSDYSEGWGRVLERHPYARLSNGTIKFSGVNSRAVFIPKQEFFKIEG
jgi:putative DNA primase/helicase